MSQGSSKRAVSNKSARHHVLLLRVVLLMVAGLVVPGAPTAPSAAQEPTEPTGSAQTTSSAPGAAETGDAVPVTGPWAPDREEPGSADAISAYTTSEDYLPRSVAYVPESDTVPSPSDVLGHLAGAPGELSSVAEVHGYFRALAAASPRVWVEPVGISEEGRDLLLAVVSSEENLADLDRLREIGHALADPRRTPREEAESLAAGGKVFYYLIGGLHSTETGSPEMLMELAYRLAVSERPQIREIRDRVVVLITPVAEPDGRDRVVEWYERHLKDRDLPWETLREIASPPYWGRYAFHDNNRDSMQRTLALTRAIHEVFHRFHPQVMHDLHESLPLLYISTGHGPYSRAVDPVTVNEWTLLAHREAAALQAQGLPGVWVWAFWDGWWPGYLVSVANNHNAVGRFYETFGNVSAETFTRDLSEVRFAGEPVTDVEWYRPWPPDTEIEWSLRNNTNYMQAGVLEALTTAARHRDELLLDHWLKAERSLRKGRTEPPHAWVFPPQQKDPGRLDHLVDLLREHAIEVHRLTGDLVLGEDENARTLAAGSYVVRMDQPYRNAAVNFLERQEFPADEPNPPYDDVAWTWPLLFGVDGEAVDDPAILEVPTVDASAVETSRAETGGRTEGSEAAPSRRRGLAPGGTEKAVPEEEPGPVLERVTAPVHTEGSVEGFGEEIFLLADTGQTSLLAARIRLGEHQVDAVESSFEAAGRTFPAGSWIVYAPRGEVERLARDLGLTFQAVLTVPDVPRRHIVDLPRLGVAHTWTSTQDTGWVRYTLDRVGMPYELVSPDDLRRGGLAARFDVLLFPDTRGDLRRIVHGRDPSLGPLAYTRTAEYPSHGVPNGSPDITGGMGFEGLLEIQRFVEGGGVLVAVANAGTLVVDGGLVRRVDRVHGDFNTPGSELRARVLRESHPLVYGYGELPSVFRGNGPLWEVDKRERGRVVLQFGTEPPEEEDGGTGDRDAKKPATDEKPVAEPPLIEEELSVEPLDGDGAVAGDGTEGAEGDLQVDEEPEPEEELETAGTAERARGAGFTDTDEAEEEPEPPAELVLSGFVRGEDEVAGKPAILDLPVGRGRVILFAFNPLHRYLNHSDFRFAWNALLHWNDLP